jgi:hypothetical protein
MKTNMKIWMLGLVVCAIFIFAACDNTQDVGRGQVDFEVTDAPSDDAEVKGVFVTIADVQVNGKSISGFTKQTINLKAYQEGHTKLLASAELDARMYNSLTLILDLNADATGNTPGCYVLTKENTKYKLATSSSGKMEVRLTKPWTVKSEARTKLVMDVDLRKALRYAQDPAVRYAFIESLHTAVRLVVGEHSSTITGTFDGELNGEYDDVIVYAYKKGAFNASTETQANENGLTFRNAVNSAKIKTGIVSNTYKLAFMEAGEYELYFAAYKKDSSTGKLMLKSVVDAILEVNGHVSNVLKVSAGTTISVSASANAVLL